MQGGYVWDAARHLASFLEVAGDRFGLLRPGVRILELGAGCGWLGLTIARNVETVAEICMTEQVEGDGLRWLNHNVEKAKANGVPIGDRVTTAACDWTWYTKTTPHGAQDHGEDNARPEQEKLAEFAESGLDTHGVVGPVDESEALARIQQDANAKAQGIRHIAETSWDLVIGSDLVYNSTGVEMLPVVLRELTKNQTTGDACAEQGPAASGNRSRAVVPDVTTRCVSRAGLPDSAWAPHRGKPCAVTREVSAYHVLSRDVEHVSAGVA
eukprot:scaffold3941_cov412-Prasinococcus_capsulatus_cf.AAC.13